MDRGGAIRVLLVDREAEFRDPLADYFEREHEVFEVVQETNAADGLDRVDGGTVDCVVSDGVLPGSDGLGFLADVRRTDPDIPFVLFVTDGSGAIVSEGNGAGVTDYLQMDASEELYDRLANRVREAVEDDGTRTDRAGETSSGANDTGENSAGNERSNQPREERTAEDGTDQRTHRAKLAELNRRIKRLHAISTTLESCTSADEIYEATIEGAVDLLGFDWSGIEIVQDGYFVLVAVSEETPLEAGMRLFPTDQGIAGEVYQTGESRVSRDLQDDETATPVHEGFRSALSVPIGDVGVFQGVSSEVGAFDRDDLDLAELLVAHLAEAIDRVEREAELRRQNERLDDFSNVVAHDLRNPINVAEVYVETLREVGDEEITGYAAEIGTSLDRMEAIIDDVLELARQGQTVEDTANVSLEGAAEVAWRNVDTGDAVLAVDEEVTLVADGSRLTRLLENLFRNAIEHGDADDVRLGAIEDGDDVTGFYVEDDGPGIAPDERDRVLEMGYTTARNGTGFGLSIVTEVAGAHDWTVDVTEGEAGGARLEIYSDGNET